MDDVNEAQQINHLPAFYSCHDFLLYVDTKKAPDGAYYVLFICRQQKKSAN